MPNVKGVISDKEESEGQKKDGSVWNRLAFVVEELGTGRLVKMSTFDGGFASFVKGNKVDVEYSSKDVGGKTYNNVVFMEHLDKSVPETEIPMQEVGKQQTQEVVQKPYVNPAFFGMVYVRTCEYMMSVSVNSDLWDESFEKSFERYWSVALKMKKKYGVD